MRVPLFPVHRPEPGHPRSRGAWAGAVAILALCASGCSSAKMGMARRSSEEAASLKEYCASQGLDGPEVRAGDSLYRAASAGFKEGEWPEARQAADLAAAEYRLAIARSELALRREQAGRVRDALAKDQDQLSTYREILTEMKATRKP